MTEQELTKELSRLLAVLPQEDRVKLLEYAHSLLVDCGPRLEESAQHEAAILLAQYPHSLTRQTN